MNFTNNPLEREMKRRPPAPGSPPGKAPGGLPMLCCPYWRGIPCGSCFQSLLKKPGGR